jgi:hypothetical protein
MTFMLPLARITRKVFEGPKSYEKWRLSEKTVFAGLRSGNFP